MRTRAAAKAEEDEAVEGSPIHVYANTVPGISLDEVSETAIAIVPADGPKFSKNNSIHTSRANSN